MVHFPWVWYKHIGLERDVEREAEMVKECSIGGGGGGSGESERQGKKGLRLRLRWDTILNKEALTTAIMEFNLVPRKGEEMIAYKNIHFIHLFYIRHCILEQIKCLSKHL